MSTDCDQTRSKGVRAQGARPPIKSECSLQLFLLDFFLSSDLVFLNLGITVETLRRDGCWMQPGRLAAAATLTDSAVHWTEFVNIVCQLFATLMSCQCRAAAQSNIHIQCSYIKLSNASWWELKKLLDIAHAVPQMCWRTDKQTNRHTHSSQYRYWRRSLPLPISLCWLLKPLRFVVHAGIGIFYNDLWQIYSIQDLCVIKLYDTRCYFNVRSKADISQLNLPHGKTAKIGLFLMTEMS